MKEKFLRELADIQTGPFGSQLHKEDYVADGTPIVTVEHLGNKMFSEQNLPRVSNTDKNRLKKYVLKQGDIVFSRVGSVDRCSYVDQKHDGWMFSGRCLRVRPTSEIDSEYLYYYFCLEETKQFVRNIAVGATMPSINTKLLGEVVVTFPELEQQKRISGILSAIDSKIEVNQKINDNLQKQLYEIYKAWYQDFLCIDNLTLIESPYGKIPQGWHYSMLGDLCKSVSVTHNFNTEQLIFLNTGDVEDGMFLHSDYMAVADMPGQAKKTIMQNDILYSEIRPINRHFAYVDFQADNYVVSTKLMVIRATSFDSRRLYHFLTLQDTLEELQMQAESRSGTFPQIRFENISKLPILIADSNTETAFVTLLHAAYNQIEHNNSENKKLSELRNSLLPQLMSGKIDVSRIRL
ncbi:restriction endonuclease subunit S [Faecalibacterium prausnitzii]|uniref:restriction endonuclease subunit S n=1 Tax=Faecalibacterium prausnitzii TaxID=853 RepID=UPI003EB79B32